MAEVRRKIEGMRIRPATLVGPPMTIKAALLAGFLVILAMWLASAWYFSRRLTETQERSVAIHARYMKGQELLFAIRSQVLVGSIYARDALIETSQSSAEAMPTTAQLRRLQAEVSDEIEQYRAIESMDEGATWGRLQEELRGYWDATVRVVTPLPNDRMAAQRALVTEVVPRREGIVRLSDEIRQVMEANVTREQEELGEVNRQARRRIWQTTAISVTLGMAIVLVSTWYVGRLEAAVREEQAKVLRNREELRHLSGRLVRAQEDERRTIARELHDEIGQALTAVDVELAGAEGLVGADTRAAGAIHEARTVTQRALSGIRDLSQLLRPSMLDDFGLPDTLKWYLRKFSDRTGVRTELVKEGLDERLPIDVEVCVYRAIQEALTNVTRHAQATSCRVFIQRLAASVIVTIEDNGIGWQASAAGSSARPDGLGLIGIRERVLELGGTFRIEGERGKGTRLTIELPLDTRT
jgi:signal transduction histidine kinase